MVTIPIKKRKQAAVNERCSSTLKKKGNPILSNTEKSSPKTIQEILVSQYLETLKL